MIQLYIDQKLADIDESVGLYLNKKYESLNNPTLYHSEYSKTISLPMTKTNKEIMFNYQRQDSVVTNLSIDPRRKTPFFLLYNGMKVLDGYLKINNANTCITDNVFEVELFGTFGMVMNEFSQLTFNKYECVSYGGSKEDKYLIQSPFSDEITVDATLVKDSFEQTSHNMNGNDILDYIKFIPTYQGQYPDFESGKQQFLIDRDEELTQERDEHYMREFRSYYQQPSIWVNKLWMMAKEKLEEITDYTLELDPSWFNQYNPYWTKLLYTCPSLYNKDDNFVETTSTFDADSLHHKLNIYEMSGLSNHHVQNLVFTPNNSVMYRDGVFNPDLKGPSVFEMNSSIMFLAKRMWSGTELFARIRKRNPLFVKFKVMNADTNEEYDHYTYMLYSHSSKAEFNSWFDEKIDCGVTSTMNPNILGDYPMGYSRQSGYWWEAPINLRFDVTENIRYYIDIDIYFANNSKAVAYSHFNNISFMWELWFYQTQIPGGSGYTIFNCLRECKCTTLDYTRSRSKIDMYRVFPKDTTLLDVILNYSKMFGLMWDVDTDTNTITVMTRNRFFSNYDVMDWSKKIDRGHEFKLDPICFDKRYVNFNVEEGEGYRYSTYFSKYGVGYGSKKIDTDYQFNSDTDDLFKNIQPAIISQKSQFSRITNTEFPDEPNFLGYNAKIYPTEHYLDNDDDGENAGNSGAFVFCNGLMEPDPRLGFQVTTDEGMVFISDDTEYMKHKNSYMWNLTMLNTEICRKLPDISTVSGSFSTHFESPAEYYFKGNFGNVRYIYDLFWEDYLNERYSVQTKKLTCYVYLTPSEYKSIDFRNFVKIENTLYAINQVFDYDFDTNSPTKVELVQVWDTEAYTDGQYSWPALSATPNSVELSKNNYVTVDIYATREWTVYSKPTWVKYVKDDDTLDLKAVSDPLRSRTGTVVLRTTSAPILEATIDVSQKPENSFFILNQYNSTVSGDGGVVSVDIDSWPTTITVVSKPDWVTVGFIPRNKTCQTDTLAQRPVNTKITTKTMVIRVKHNYRMDKRTGNIVLTNGILNRTFSVTQLGKSIIFENYDEQPIHIPIGEIGVWQPDTNLQVDPDTVELTKGTVTPPVKSIHKLQVEFEPELDTTDYGDGCIETCSGGMVSILTMDGRTINKNYNYGDVLDTYEVLIHPNEGGHYTVDGVDYYGEFYAVVDAGTEFVLTAEPDTGYTFLKWDDENTDTPRTLVVNSDIELQPIFEPMDNHYLYDNTKIVAYDNNEKTKI